MLQQVAKGLAALKDEVVFVGGVVTSLYVNDPAAPPVTASDDIDCVVKVAGLGEYAKFEDALRKLGFKRPVEEEDQKIICRWDYRGILVDVMPTDEKILGFSNKWYSDAVQNKVTIKLPDGTPIFIFSTPYFIATKLEALRGRGGDDIRLSQDLEDIVSVMDGCTDIEAQLNKAPGNVREYFREEFSRLLKDRGFLNEAIAGFLQAVRDYPTRSAKMIQIMERLLKDKVG